jgi:nicotinate-nucleotide adenylyltransferase
MPGLTKHIAIYGGSFDPVHLGHIKTAEFIQTTFHFDKFFFLPCKKPLLKSDTEAEANIRVEMLKLAIKSYPSFEIDTREVERDSPSYMLETLLSFRNEYKNAAITLIIGWDAFIKLPEWYQWQEIPKLANLLVIHRENFQTKTKPPVLEKLIATLKTNHQNDLKNYPNGKIYFLNAGNYDISSTEIRAMLKSNQSVEKLLSTEVFNYIKKYKLYH